MNLFEEEESHHFKARAPLADRMRPRRWDEFIGQEDLIGFGRPLRQLIESDSNISFILWGPPGSGKTTIARIIARVTASRFHEISAVNTGVADIRKIISFAEKALKTRINSLFYLSMRFTVSIKCNKIRFYHILKMEH